MCWRWPEKSKLFKAAMLKMVTKKKESTNNWESQSKKVLISIICTMVSNQMYW